MNPNRLNRELRSISGNIQSPKLPGGTLINAVFDRRLMTWSDRGGASRIFGDIWSEYCWNYLSSERSPLRELTNESARTRMIRLDDDPRIAIQAGRNKLTNPDFLVMTEESDGSSTLRAIDAKFAVDRLRRTQIAATSTRELIELPGSLALQAISGSSLAHDLEELTYLDGHFLGPRSLINDYFQERLTSGENPEVSPAELQLIEANPERLFEPVEEFELTGYLRTIDDLAPQSESVEVVIGMYYIRLACAARWFETQRNTPLLSTDTTQDAEPDQVLSEARLRTGGHRSAFELIEEWSVTAEQIAERQKQIRDAARLPVRMSEIRKLVDRAGLPDDRKAAREIRKTLEKYFSQRLNHEVGEIPANTGEPMSSVLERISTTSRRLRPEMLTYARRALEQIESKSSPDPVAEQDI